MQNGFIKVIPDLIAKYPGCTAQEYAKMAIDQGICGSNSQNSVFSLKTMLMKEYREGRLPQIKIVKVDGKTRYFPANNIKSAMRAYFRFAVRREATNFKRGQPNRPRYL